MPPLHTPHQTDGWPARRRGEDQDPEGTGRVSARIPGARTHPIIHPPTLIPDLRFHRSEQRFRVPHPEDAGRTDAGAAQPRKAFYQRRYLRRPARQEGKHSAHWPDNPVRCRFASTTCCPLSGEPARRAVVAWPAAPVERAEPPRSPRGCTGMRRFCRWLLAERWTRRRPTDGIEIPAPPGKPVPILTDDEIAALLTACAVPRGRPGVLDRAAGRGSEQRSSDQGTGVAECEPRFGHRRAEREVRGHLADQGGELGAVAGAR